MGTNFYLMSRNKKLMREHFAVETEYDIKDIGKRTISSTLTNICRSHG